MSNYVIIGGELCHYGTKGMKWGVRRYQNKDGSLTPAGKKRVSKEYKKAAQKVTDTLNKNYTKMYVSAWNKAADYMNDGVTEKFNQDQRKKYGENYMDRDGYVSDYQKIFDAKFSENFNKSLNNFYKTDKTYKAAKDLVDKYKMTEWNEFARENEAAVKSVRDAVEKAKRG